MTRIAVPELPPALRDAVARLKPGDAVILEGPDGKPVAALVSANAALAAEAHALPPLAPDGLPWPEGYHDRPPRIALEEATARFGVRPSRYFKGFPCYTQEEAGRPEFRSGLPEESPEVQAAWQAEWDAAQAAAASAEHTV